MFKFFKKMKERWNCKHDYKLIKMNRVNYVIHTYDSYIYYTHDAQCEKCGKIKYAVHTSWVKDNLGHKYMVLSGSKDKDLGVIEKDHPQRSNIRTRRHPTGIPIRKDDSADAKDN